MSLHSFELLIKELVIDLLSKAVTKLPLDVKHALEKSYKMESSKMGREILKTILENIELAEKKKLPLCQDTGIPLFYITLGAEFASKFEINNLERFICEAVREGTAKIPLRPNVVHPITRKNTGDNVGIQMPHIEYTISQNDFLELTVLPKGGGSENMSAFRMLPPTEGVKGIKKFVLETVVSACGKPCPPIIIGIGIGGSADIAMKLAKKALLKKIGFCSMLEFEDAQREIFEAVNSTGIGPMGLGGSSTTLGINVEHAYCHTASLPVGINIQCWAGRKATGRLYKDGRIEYLI